jgi:type I restriction enzyme S subunit
LLKKIFPKNGEDKPEIRFAGFTNAWEQRKVESIAEQFYGGDTPPTSNGQFWTGDIPWIQSSDLTENELFGVVPRRHISNQAVSASATKVIPQNSIAVITRVGVGKLAFMPYSYASSQDFLSLSGLKMDGIFAAYVLYKKLRSELHIVQGTSIKGITKEELLAKVIMAPKQTAEQEQIGTFFQHLDHLITLHQRELEQQKLVKKYLMPQIRRKATRKGHWYSGKAGNTKIRVSMSFPDTPFARLA